MKQYISIFIIFVSIILLIVSCSESVTPTNTNGNSSVNVGIISFGYSPDENTHKTKYSLIAEFYSPDNDSILIDVGKLKICGCEFAFNSHPGIISPVGVYGIIELDSAELGNSLSGKTCVWSIDGNKNEGIPGFSRDIFLPKPIFSFKPLQNSSVSLKDGFDVEWEPDIENKDSIIILVTKFSDFDTSLVDTSIDYPTYKVPETGNYHINPDTSLFKVGEKINVELLRRKIHDFYLNKLQFRFLVSSQSNTYRYKLIE